MATFYLDFEGGNDANDGTTFANRWKTITSGATAARTAPGDIIRIKKSPDPTSLGTTGAFTNKSATVTLGSAKNVLITNCDTAWTASANVTATADTTIYRTSTGSSKLAVAAGFTTGLAAYFALGGAQNYSAYQGITLWVRTGTKALAAGEASIRLCSDAAGVTTVDTLALPAISQTGQWIPVHVDKGSALGASIQSIALYIDTDNGAIDIYLDNISTTKAVGDDCLTLKTLIGKNTTDETWWCLRQINGTALTIDSDPSDTVANLANMRGYYGVTETVTCYIRKTIIFDLVAAQSTAVTGLTYQESGTAGNHIEYSGGWDTTNMSTQDGHTYLDGQSGFGTGLTPNFVTYITIRRLHARRFYTGMVMTNGGEYKFESISSCHNAYRGLDAGTTLTQLGTDACHFNANQWYGIGNVGSPTNLVRIFAHSNGTAMTNGSGALLTATGSSRWTEVRFCNNIMAGWSVSGQSEWGGLTIDKIVTSDNGGYILVRSGNDSGANDRVWNLYVKEWEANGNGAYGVELNDLWRYRIGKITATGNGYSGVYLSGIGVIEEVTTSGNGVSGLYPPASYPGSVVVLKSSMAEATKLYTWGAGNNARGWIKLHNYNNTANDHRWYHAWNGTVFAEASVRHTASGLAWKMSPVTTTFVTEQDPLVLPIARIAVTANQTLSASVWLRRTNTGISGKFVCRGKQIAGILVDTSVSMTAAQDTWEKVTLTLGPTEDGVIDLEVHAYGGSTYSLYVDDFSASQV